mmetsp:Transcript_41273/g.103662  ORF Transcript_41273/g.103662 Transcript_41273/m.103662 type:complete len:206 (-) Transcript_41273:91-708(-)
MGFVAEMHAGAAAAAAAARPSAEHAATVAAGAVSIPTDGGGGAAAAAATIPAAASPQAFAGASAPLHVLLRQADLAGSVARSDQASKPLDSIAACQLLACLPTVRRAAHQRAGPLLVPGVFRMLGTPGWPPAAAHSPQSHGCHASHVQRRNPQHSSRKRTSTTSYKARSSSSLGPHGARPGHGRIHNLRSWCNVPLPQRTSTTLF